MAGFRAHMASGHVYYFAPSTLCLPGEVGDSEKQEKGSCSCHVVSVCACMRCAHACGNQRTPGTILLGSLRRSFTETLA